MSTITETTNTNDTDFDTDTKDYDAINRSLFAHRATLQAQIADIERELESMPGSRLATKRLNRLMRDLDDSTAAIVKANYGLVAGYVSRFSRSASRADVQDFEAAGQIGLLKAIETYDADKGKFSSWCYRPVQREVLREVHKAEFSTLRAVDFERRPHILSVQQELAETLGRTPTTSEIADVCGYSDEQVAAVTDAASLDSLDRPVGEDGYHVGDLVPDESADFAEKMSTVQFVEALGRIGIPHLAERELFVLVRRFGLDGEPSDNLTDIGDMMGLSRESVRQCESKALSKINHPIVLRRILAEVA